MQFSNSVRSQVKEENPGLSVTEIAKLIGTKWNELSAEDKEPFVKKAAEDKVRYEREMEVYKASKAANDDDGDADEPDDAMDS